jgi:DNA invertase Pin-like site-specific DNA recombinase
MPKLINRESVIEMKKQGFTCKQIAARLGCSLRQVKRLTKGMQRGKAVDSEVEKVSREFLSEFLPGTAVALRFGITRQALTTPKVYLTKCSDIVGLRQAGLPAHTPQRGDKEL